MNYLNETETTNEWTMNKNEKYIDYYLMQNSTHVFDSEQYIRRGIVYNKEATDFAKNKIISFIFGLSRRRGSSWHLCHRKEDKR